MEFRIWRSLLAIVAGYVLAALGIGVLRGITVILLRHFAADGGDWTAYTYRLLKLTYTLASATGGGYLAAAVAHRKPRWHAFAVSALLAGAFLVSHSKYAAQPAWYFDSLVILALVGPMIGGYLEHRPAARDSQQEFRSYRAAEVLVGGFLVGATIVNRISPSLDLLQLNNAAAAQGNLTTEIVACVLGACLVYAGLRSGQ